MIDCIVRMPLQVFEDERGWFLEIQRASKMPKTLVQTNVSFSRKGVVRGLHFHQRGQDDLFACLSGTARVVVLDTESGDVFTEDIGESNPVALYIPGRSRTASRRSPTSSSVTTSRPSTTPPTPTSTRSPGTTPA